MKKDAITWAEKVRKNVLNMMTLLLFFISTGIGYYIWGDYKLSHLNTLANRYHLASNNHFLLAKEHIRDLEFNLLKLKDTARDVALDPQIKTNTDMDLHISLREIDLGVALQKQFSNPDFDVLLNQANSSLEEFNALYLSIWSHKGRINEVIMSAEYLSSNLENIILLHRIEFDQINLTIKNQSTYYFIFNSLLFTVLLILSLYMARQGLRTIDKAIRRQQKDKARIQHQAHFDHLTQLPNRFLALDRLSQAITKSKRSKDNTSVLFLDLDDFKKINDTMGHSAGDLLLVEASKRLLTVVRKVDTVGRLGGDEFIIVLEDIQQADMVQRVADKIIKQFRSPFIIEGHEIILTISMGISVYPGDGEDATDLIRSADSAMYYSKENGRNMYSFFTQSMNAVVSRRLAIEEQLYDALKRNEFEVHYQPKIDLSNGKIMGAEALLRWNNPTLGQVSPIEFINIAEQTGTIIELGFFVLAQAMATCHNWKTVFNHTIKMSINLSPRQFRDSKLTDFIQEQLKINQLIGSDIELEITEGVFLSGHDYVQKAITQLGELNIELAMDDFGTGYSSLSYLRNFPFSVLKIDRCFISSLIENSSDQKLVNAAISLGHSMGMKVVAEGVETQAQHEYLEQQGCDYVQGYLYGKPMTAQSFELLLNEGAEITPTKSA